MTQKETESPCEFLLRTIKNMSFEDSVHAGLEALVTAIGFEQAKICLIRRNGQLETADAFSAGGTEATLLSSIPAHECMPFMFIMLSRNSITELTNKEANQTDWKPLFKLCGEDYAANVTITLALQGTTLGLLVLQSRNERKLSDAERKLVSTTADALSLMLYHAKTTSELLRRVDALESAHPGSSEADKVWEGWLAEANAPHETCPDCKTRREKLGSN